MAAPEGTHWYLHEWFAAQGKIQRSLVTELGWLPAKANKIWHGVQEPKLSEIAEIAAMLNIDPNELLIHPEQAMAARRLHSAVLSVVTPTPRPPHPPASAASKTGTND